MSDDAGFGWRARLGRFASELRADLEERAAGNLKRVARTGGAETVETAAAFCDIRTVWHPARI